jgi:hypothetical protein
MMNWLEMWGFILYIYKGLYLTSFLYLVFFAMCVAGHLRWRKELDEQPPLAAAAAV